MKPDKEAAPEWVGDLRDYASLMVDEVIAKVRLQLDRGEGLSVADQRLMLEQLISERNRLSTATLPHTGERIAALEGENERLRTKVAGLSRPSLFWIDEDPESGYCDPWEALEAALYHSNDEGVAAIREGRELGTRYYARLAADDEIGDDEDWLKSFDTRAEADEAIAAERARRTALAGEQG